MHNIGTWYKQNSLIYKLIIRLKNISVRYECFVQQMYTLTSSLIYHSRMYHIKYVIALRLFFGDI